MAKSTKKTSSALPSFLNVNRSISPSEGLLFGETFDKEGHLEKRIPVEVNTRGIRGAISNYSGVHKGSKAQSSENVGKLLDPENANLQQIEVSFMPHAAERLSVDFSLVVQANSLVPSGCNDATFYAKIKELTTAYADAGGYEHLAERYVWNVINGRTLWRNRFACNKKAEVKVDGETFVFDVDNINLNRFDRTEMPAGFEKIAAKFADALSGRSAPLFLDIKISGFVPKGAEVYPSQEFLPDAGKRKKEIGKVLSSVNVKFEDKDIRQATLHSQKIGNAIRVIDEWHGQTDEYGATAIEAYGYVQSRNTGVRLPDGADDIYEMLMAIEEHTAAVKASDSAEAIPGDIHYMIAMLIRGGVFSGDSKS